MEHDVANCPYPGDGMGSGSGCINGDWYGTCDDPYCYGGCVFECKCTCKCHKAAA